VQGERAIKETGIGLAGKREGRDAEEHDCRKKGACSATWRRKRDLAPDFYDVELGFIRVFGSRLT
jgi:hypothetical protein